MTPRKNVGDDAPLIHRPRRRTRPAAEQHPLPLPPDAAPAFEFVTGQVRHRAKGDHLDHVGHLMRRSRRSLARDRAEQAARDQALDLRPRVEFVKEGRQRKWYFVDRDGARWRIYDMLPPGRKSSKTSTYPVEPPHNWATERAFVREDGTQRRYMFNFSESHALETEFLERQLERSR